MNQISLNSVTYAPGDAEYIFQDFNLTLDAGEWTVLTGESGTGKTTLGLLLAGGIAPEAGNVTIDGRPLNATDESPGFLHQNPEYQILGTTVERDIVFGMENRGLEPGFMRSRLEVLLDQFHLRSARNSPIDGLSGGMKQRTALAALLAVEHPYLILDEPTSYLDYETQEVLIKTINNLRSNGIGILWITQYPGEAVLGDRVVELGEGKIIRDSDKSQFLQIADTGIESGYGHDGKARLSGEPVILNARDILFRYDSEQNREPFCLEVPKYRIRAGERQGWYGYSGTGKSTFAKLLTGMLSPDAGEMECEFSQNSIVYVPQFAERMIYSGTLEQTLQLLEGRPGFHRDEYRLQLERQLDTMGIPVSVPFQRAIWDFSGGEQRRIVLAVALALQPELLILDEPTIGVSPVDRDRVNRVFTSTEISSIICISHEYAFLRQHTDRGVYFNEGTGSGPAEWDILESRYHYRKESPVMAEIREYGQRSGVSK